MLYTIFMFFERVAGQFNIVFSCLQVLCIAEAVLFTEKCEEALRNSRLHTLKTELEAQLESYTATEINHESSDVDATVLELKLKALILDTIHFIDVVEQLQKDNAKSVEDWAWQKQLRFYFNKQGMGF